jgi:hypothetical protein
MENKLRSFAERIYKIVEECEDYYEGVEELEEVLRLMPVNIKEGITNTKVEITKEGIVVEPNVVNTKENTIFEVKKKKKLYKKEDIEDNSSLNKTVRNS